MTSTQAHALHAAPHRPPFARVTIDIDRTLEPAAISCVGEQVTHNLAMLRKAVDPVRRVVHEGDVVYHAGSDFLNLYVVGTGMVKLVTSSPDGREQVVSLKFRGDWLGFDGIDSQAYRCDAVAMDVAEVWVVPYRQLLAASHAQPALLALLHNAMSAEISRDRDSLMAICTLPANARVADFLRFWAQSLARCGLRTDQITLRMTRAEIGNYLGVTLETVSRALSLLAREGLISFVEKGRRELRIENVDALASFVRASVAATH